MQASPRPRLGSRAISDMHPLINPAHNPSEDRDLGRGTHATSGGARVISGGRTALGGIAPMSPFLPLPPAPQANEGSAAVAAAAAMTVKHSTMGSQHLSVQQPASIHLRSVSGSDVENQSVKQSISKSRPSRGAAHMIRSYSMPVATQDAYEAERESVKRRHQQLTAKCLAQNDGERSWEADWVQGNEINGKAPGVSISNYHHHVSNAANTMVVSASSMGAKQHSNTFQHDYQRYSSRKKQPSPRIQPRSPLSIITINETAAPSRAEGSAEMDLGSGSDEAEVITPRAMSPSKDYFSKSISNNDDDYPDAGLFDFIHPDHLQPPSSCSL